MLMRQYAVLAACLMPLLLLADVANADLQAAFAQSQQSGKPLLVVVSGEG